MKALCITAPRAAEYRDLAAPTPGPGEALLRVRYVGYCGSDLSTWRGANPLAAYPRVPGHEVSGEIVALGPDAPPHLRIGGIALVVPYTACGACSACRAGRANCCRDNRTLGVQRDGALLERLAVPAEKLLTSPTLGLRELALVEPLTIGFHAAARGRVGADDTVLIFGCGMIGLGAIAAAAERGARVVAVDLDPAKLALAKRVGAREALIGDATLRERLRELTAGDGPSVAIEAVGIPDTFRACVEEVGFAGRVVYIGYAKQPVAYETRLFVQKELDVLGSRNATPADFAAAMALLESGRFPVEAVVSRVVPFAGAAQALVDWDADPGRITKILVDVAA